MIKLQICLIILCIVEAWLESYIIKLKDGKLKEYEFLNKREHQVSALYYMLLLGSFVAINTSYWPILLSGPFIRRVIFSPALNLIGIDGDRRPIFYVSNSGIEGKLKKLFGEFTGFVIFIISLLIILVVNFFLNGH